MAKSNRKRSEVRTFSWTASQVAFPLGGIGTGNVSIGARGELRDWEIFNRPGKGKLLPYTFFALWYESEGGKVAKVLEAPFNKPYLQYGHTIEWAAGGFMPWYVPGIPRMKSASLKGEYPFAFVEFKDDSPLRVSLTAFTPFCPSDTDFSSKPCAVFSYRIKNTSRRSVRASVCGSLINPVGYLGEDVLVHSPAGNSYLGGNFNEMRREGEITCLFLGTRKYPKDSVRFGNVSLATMDGDVSFKTAWDRTGWWSTLRLFWRDFAEDGALEDNAYLEPTADGKTDIGSICSKISLRPGEEKTVRFALAWYFPNRVYNWDQKRCTCEGERTIRNYYATLFDDSSQVAFDALKNYDEYFERTERFRGAFFSSTLPWEALEIISTQISTIRTNTCMAFEDGTFWGYEGCGDSAGCCLGNCAHVWNYAQTLAFLFPELERKMRQNDFTHNVGPEGDMVFRSSFPGEERLKMKPAADGQMGAILRLYREWKVSGDDGFLRQLYPQAKLCLDYVLKEWDKDGDGVLEGEQHNTYDIEFFGANPLTGFFYLGALKAVAEMAEFLGERDVALKYRQLFEIGSKNLVERCWNGEYFQQDPEVVDKHPYQHGSGCLSDQLLGQWLASLLGLGHLVPEEYVKSALKSIFKYNFKRDLSGHTNLQRSYAVNDEAGLVLCTWPRGGEPKDPFPYSDEVWTGIEFHVASHLIMEGFRREAMQILRAIAERQDGEGRNPWNHPECGHHYARAMSSWGVLLAFSGFSFDISKGEIGFAPKIDRDNFKTFWAVGEAWGTYSQTKTKNGFRLEFGVLHGSPNIRRIRIALRSKRCTRADRRLSVKTGRETIIEINDPSILKEERGISLTLA